jgi:hypothetical protein
MVDGVNGRLRDVLEIGYYLLYFLPSDLLTAVTPVLEHEYNLLQWDRPLNFGVFDSWLIDELSISVIILNFEEERLQVDSLVSKGIQSVKYLSEFFPILLTQHTSFSNVYIIEVVVGGDIGSIVEENIQKLLKR